MSNNLETNAMVKGFPSITSTNVAVAPATCNLLGIKANDRIRFSLNPSYKGAEPCIFVNLHHARIDYASRSSEILYKARSTSDDNRLVLRLGHGASGKALLTLTGPAKRSILAQWMRNMIEGWRVADVSMRGAAQCGHQHRLVDMPWLALVRYVQPAKCKERLESLPASLYRSEAARWCGSTRLTKKAECLSAILDLSHTLHQFDGGSPIANGGYCVTAFETANNCVDQSGPNGTLSPAPAPAAAPVPAPAPTPAPAPASSNLADQIASLTQRADGFDAMRSKAESLEVEVLKLLDEVKELKARPQVTIKTGPTFTPSGGVDIAGTELPHFKLSPASPWSVPKINPQYKLNGWSASFSAGDLKVDYTLGQVVKSITSGTPTRVIGRPATGKTSGIEQACAHMGVPVRVIQCGKGLTEFTLLGEQTIENGDVVWKDGILPALFKGAVVSDEARQTPHIVMLDEGDHLKAEIQSILHGVLEGGMLDLPNGEKVVVPENVIFVMTANTHGVGDLTGRHASAQVSDDAFISRWTRAYNVNYLDSDDEKNLLLSYGVPTNIIDPLMQFIEGTRKQSEMIDRGEISDGVRTPVTLRSLIPFAQDCANGVDPKAAFCATVMGGFSPDEYDKVRELIRATMDW